MRFGFGFDIHQLVENRKLILGGIEIPFNKGLLGHSDADALSHAICDALLGAATLGNIGTQFPNTDVQYKNISSLLLLERTALLIRENHFEISNIDSTIVLQEPIIHTFISYLRKNIAHSLSLELQQVSVKATTSEHLGFIGRNEGIAVFAVASLYDSTSPKSEL
ncbi:MAG: 2-C-methyl-D-erythritol 2,4-cyclodiphosphate synthase [Ignavibacteria bacterium]|nr:2-C-methyl-D-erythritol 2,4-cyclodiphosphate synthase [Ignavibacteria bacterium]